MEIVGKIAVDALTPGSRTEISSIIRDAICGNNADDQQVEDTIADMFEKLGPRRRSLCPIQKK